MAAITAALIKQVREETGAGMMDVKKALTEAEGDVARAKEIIRAKGIQAAGKREGRKAQEGTIASTVVESANGQTGYAVELNSRPTSWPRPRSSWNSPAACSMTPSRPKHPPWMRFWQQPPVTPP